MPMYVRVVYEWQSFTRARVGKDVRRKAEGGRNSEVDFLVGAGFEKGRRGNIIGLCSTFGDDRPYLVVMIP